MPKSKGCYPVDSIERSAFAPAAVAGDPGGGLLVVGMNQSQIERHTRVCGEGPKVALRVAWRAQLHIARREGSRWQLERPVMTHGRLRDERAP